jgi:rare lipoprotein A
MTKTMMLVLTFTVSLATIGSAQTPAAVGQKETGLAAVYTDALNGHVTASGQVYDPAKLTAAHKTLPFGTKVRVTNTKNNKTVELRITDRGPKQAARVLDISPAAAARLGINRRVMREVTLEVVELGSGKTTRQRAR